MAACARAGRGGTESLNRAARRSVSLPCVAPFRQRRCGPAAAWDNLRLYVGRSFRMKAPVYPWDGSWLVSCPCDIMLFSGCGLSFRGRMTLSVTLPGEPGVSSKEGYAD